MSKSTLSAAPSNPPVTPAPGVKPKRARKPKKPAKPYPDFPLFPHATRRWAKKIKGKLHYFGPWADPQAALKRYLDEKDTIYLTGAKPAAADPRLTMNVLCEMFIQTKKRKMESGELSPRTWGDYLRVCKLLYDHFGRDRIVETLTAEDFDKLRAELAQRCGPVRLKNVVNYMRIVFKWAFDCDLISRPVRHGPEFRGPSKKVLALHRASQGERLFTAVELRQILAVASPTFKAMTLLGLNCGLGNADVALIRESNLDLDRGWLTLVRSKTGIMRRCPLWPETVQAIRESLAVRRKPKNPAHAGLVFLTAWGRSWQGETAVTNACGPLLDQLGLHRPGLSFYTLRHVFRTIADETKDQPACNAIMGHSDPTMAGQYRERIGDGRLQAVVEHVRGWLYGNTVE